MTTPRRAGVPSKSCFLPCPRTEPADKDRLEDQKATPAKYLFTSSAGIRYSCHGPSISGSWSCISGSYSGCPSLMTCGSTRYGAATSSGTSLGSENPCQPLPGHEDSLKDLAQALGKHRQHAGLRRELVQVIVVADVGANRPAVAFRYFDLFSIIAGRSPRPL